MSSKVDVLGADFAAADRPAWLGLVEKTLGGAAFEAKLVTHTPGDLTIQPLYQRSDAGPGLDPKLRERPGFDAHRAWDVRALVDHPDPEQARLNALDELEGGASSLLIKIDPSGQNGVAVGSAKDLEHALSGVLFDLAPVALDAGLLGVEAADWLNAVASARTLRPRLQLHLDPIGSFAVSGATPGPIEAHVKRAALASLRTDAETAFLATGEPVHEAGGGEADEIAFAAAAGLAYLKSQTEAGAALDDALSRVALGVTVDADYFTSIAKIRALRTLWAKIAVAAGASPRRAQIEARSSRRMLAALDPWVNMLRLTAACFAGGVGGADAIALDAFTQPLGRPTAFARRQRRNIQLVLMEEAHIGRVADPAGGAYFVEALTGDLARAAWKTFQSIEDKGGVVEALVSGYIADKVAEVQSRRAQAVARRRAGIVGVSEFPSLGQAPVETLKTDGAAFAKPRPEIGPPGNDSHCPPIPPWRAPAQFQALRARAERMSPGPIAYLATLGSVKDSAPRTGFMTNALASGGIAARTGPVEGYEASETTVVALCGSDAAYAQDGGAAARALIAAGARRLYLAGRPGGLEKELRDAGVTGFIFAGSDLPNELDAMLRAFEEERL